MSERVKLFGSLAQRIRRSTCPAADHRDKIRCPNAHAKQSTRHCKAEGGDQHEQGLE
jgi:hypothetical protein